MVNVEEKIVRHENECVLAFHRILSKFSLPREIKEELQKNRDRIVLECSLLIEKTQRELNIPIIPGNSRLKKGIYFLHALVASIEICPVLLFVIPFSKKTLYEKSGALRGNTGLKPIFSLFLKMYNYLIHKKFSLEETPESLSLFKIMYSFRTFYPHLTENDVKEALEFLEKNKDKIERLAKKYSRDYLRFYKVYISIPIFIIGRKKYGWRLTSFVSLLNLVNYFPTLRELRMTFHF